MKKLPVILLLAACLVLPGCADDPTVGGNNEKTADATEATTDLSESATATGGSEAVQDGTKPQENTTPDHPFSAENAASETQPADSPTEGTVSVEIGAMPDYGIELPDHEWD